MLDMLRRLLPEHEVRHVSEIQWAGKAGRPRPRHDHTLEHLQAVAAWITGRSYTDLERAVTH
ncbi:MAG: hypothetical protein JO362_23025 [Streptomycetaceae bacterium]|nr:hypothetical protein [Streptomycetaceae bacterium]